MPEKTKLLDELSSLESELSRTRSTLMKLNRNVQANNILFKEWQDEAAEAIDRAEDRAQTLVKDTLTDSFFDLLRWKVKKTPSKIKKIDQFEEIITLKDISAWHQIDQDSWEEIGESLVSAAQNLPLSPEVKAVVSSTQSIIDSSYDITAWFASWKNIQQLEKNSDAYLMAVEKISTRMKKIVPRIKEIKVQLREDNI